MPSREKWLTDPTRPKPAPPELSGKWIAWNRQMSTVLGYGDAASEAFDLAVSAGHPRDQIVLQKVPRAGTVFIGRA